MELLDNLKWRYATKQFDPNKKLTQEQLNILLEAINLAPTSYGLQQYKVLVIEDQQIKDKLKASAYGQGQVSDASQVIVFAAKNNLSDNHVDEFIDRIANITGASKDQLAEYEGMMKNKINATSAEDLLKWASKQCYIGLGVLMSTCAELKIDSCPMEGFDPAQFDEILGLKEKNLTSVVMATIGYRSKDDAYQNRPKVRKSLDELVVKY